MTVALPLVTVLVPAREEASDIEACLQAIAAQDYPVNRMEVIVVDGCSADGTADIARRSFGRWAFGSSAVLLNAGGTASSNLNAGLERATGDIVCRVDARTRIQPHYVRTCVDILSSRPDVSVVGGAQVAVARDATARAVGIARALNNRWTMGGSRYRRGRVSGPSDTVYLGAFRRSDLEAVGGWDERLVSNQDFDLNQRMLSRGLVWFEATLRSGYVPRATVGQLGRQYRRFGRAKVDYWRTSGRRPQPRQWALLAGPPLLFAAFAYALVSVGDGGVIALLAGALAALLIVEGRGTHEPRATTPSRAFGVTAIVVIAVAWWSGVAQRFIVPARAADPAVRG